MMDVIQNIKGLSADTRDIKSGYLFAALKGTRFNGRDFIDQAIMNGATHILAEKGTNVSGAQLIESDNPRRDFALLVSSFYGAQPDNIVAVTGTNGKTSVADFIRQIFEMLDLKSASLGTLGLVSKHAKGYNVMTTPDPVQLHSLLSDLRSVGVDHLAMEASSHGLDQYRLDGVQIKVAAFTNLSQDHLDYHGDMETYFKAKERLFADILPEGGIAVVNIDDEWGQKINTPNAITYGQNKNAALRLISQKPSSTGQDIQIQYGDDVHNIHLPLIGLFQAYNALCAAACCIGLGLNKNDVFSCLTKLKGVKGRVELASSIQDRAAYIDYAHTPDALEKVLTALRPHVSGRLICVFGAGGDRDKSKRPQMGRVVCEHADIAIITDDNPRTEDPDKIRNEIFSACSSAENIGGRGEAITHAVSILNAGDVLLVAGKGHEQGQTIGTTTHPFDDLTETQKAMEAKYK